MGANDQLDKLDYYTLLGVSDDSSVDEIKRAFRQFAKRYHPDRHRGAPPEKLERATQIYRRGGEAFQVLVDERTRKAYDDALRKSGTARLGPEAVERALHPPAAPAPEAKQHPIRNAQARVHYHEATLAAKRGDLMAAWRSIQTAMSLEGPSPYLDKALAQVETRLRRGR